MVVEVLVGRERDWEKWHSPQTKSGMTRNETAVLVTSPATTSPILSLLG